MDNGECPPPNTGDTVTLQQTDIEDIQILFNVSCVLQAHWWAVLLMGIALIMLMAGFIKICSVHTPSSNPKLPPPKPLPGTVIPVHSLSLQMIPAVDVHL